MLLGSIYKHFTFLFYLVLLLKITLFNGSLRWENLTRLW